MRGKELCFSTALLLAMVLGPLAVSAGEKKEGFRAMLEARAAKAQKEKDVKALVECAFALYPVEAAGKVKEPRSAALLNQAADVVLEKKDKQDANLFLETAGPLTALLGKGKREKLSELAAGKKGEDIAREEAEVARGPVQKAGKDFFDPEVKTRDKGLMSALGRGVVLAAHPTGQRPGMVNYRISNGSPTSMTASITMEYFGAITGWRYVADIDIDFSFRDGRPQITYLGYRDNNGVPQNELNLRRFQDEFNRGR